MADTEGDDRDDDQPKRQRPLFGELVFKRGIECPRCGCRDLRVYRTTNLRASIIRIRYCRNCGATIPTRETPS